MAKRQQQSKRDRARRKHYPHLAGQPVDTPAQQPATHPSREPTYGYCPDCGDPIWNRGAHAEACIGIARRRCEVLGPPSGSFGVRRQCVRPWAHNGGHIYD